MLGAQVKRFEAFRRSLPEGSRLIVSKNTLLCAPPLRLEPLTNCSASRLRRLHCGFLLALVHPWKNCMHMCAHEWLPKQCNWLW